MSCKYTRMSTQTCEGDFFGKRAFAEVIKLRISLRWVGLNSDDKGPYKRWWATRGGRQTLEGGIYKPRHTQNWQLPLQAARGMERVLPQSLQKEPMLPTPDFRAPGLQNCEGITFCYFKPPSCGALLLQSWETDALRRVEEWTRNTTHRSTVCGGTGQKHQPTEKFNTVAQYAGIKKKTKVLTD